MNVINFSGGRTSAYMAKRLIDEGGEYLVTFQNTGKEMPHHLTESGTMNQGDGTK